MFLTNTHTAALLKKSLKDMSYVSVFINAIVVALMAIYVYQNERRMGEHATDQELSSLEKEFNVLKLERKKIEIRKAIQEETDYINKLQFSEQSAGNTPLKGLNYNYFDEMAQTYCSSRLPDPAFVFAIRRNCHGIAPTCNDICRDANDDMLNAINHGRKNVACFDAIKIRKDHTKLQINPNNVQPDAGKISTVTYGYGMGGCTWTPNHCGPNYCCCKAF
ncbi:uncharacterized protein LOC127726268 [Mytilus californianus]|uniref:uncharacterized protein LOC127726268 n=1 Tax=Mytilus californianus TaxID=6549 RepID=UPI0022454643|nr:uncharacterized protein LOC127726268 [Mytilus californianus]